MLDAAAVLHAHGQTDIQTATQAASALRSTRWRGSFRVVQRRIIGTGLLAIPALAGSAAYALAEASSGQSGWKGISTKPWDFTGTLCVATLFGVALDFTSINRIKALFWSAVINGVAAVPIMFVMTLMTANRKLTGTLRLPMPQRIVGWAATAVMFAVAAGMIATWINLVMWRE